jgi:Na+-transporting methylmalonyl-CoA/oxaloacetate decarboxylase beta subunit
MKIMMMALVCAAMVALSGCYAAKKHAESIGIIGGEDGPTAIWITTRLPWSKDCPQEK